MHSSDTLMALAGATLRFPPPYSHDFNPIEAAWALIKNMSGVSKTHPRRRAKLCLIQGEAGMDR